LPFFLFEVDVEFVAADVIFAVFDIDPTAVEFEASPFPVALETAVPAEAVELAEES